MARDKTKRFRNGIQKSRQRAGYENVDRLSEELGISKSTISGWEQGFSFPRPEQLLVLADHLGCSIDDLYGYRPRTRDTTEISDAIKRSDLRLFERVYDAAVLSGDHDLLMAFVMVMAGDYSNLKNSDLIALDGRLNAAMSAVEHQREKTRGEGGDSDVRPEERRQIAG